MIKDDSVPQEQSAQEETHPEGLDHDDLVATEMVEISGGAPVEGYMHLSLGCHPN
jgi:hypothetical protein